MLNIRQVKKEDLNTLGEIYVKVYEFLNVGEKWDNEFAVKLMEYWFNKQPGLAFLAE